MQNYVAPQREIKFVMDELHDMQSHYKTLKGCEDASEEIVDAIREEGAKFVENVLAPLNQSGDREGCTWSKEGVTTPKGFKEAYKQCCDNGWPSLIHPEEFGGQGLPTTVGAMFTEMTCSANLAFSFMLATNGGSIETIETWGTKEQKQAYLPKIVSGQWSGTMCLTESHAGTDLGLLRTKAVPNADGSYNLTGQKIFITEGEHDKAENIVHIVIARIAGAPAGTKGISLFIVPKFLPDANGEKGERNAVSCGSIEHKMGIHAGPTCVMNFDGSKGYLLGPENKGLNCMFTFMNNARLGVAIQGTTHGEIAFQKALAYAKDRLQMRSLTGPKNPELPADPIIVHPDVRRMLLQMKSVTEGGRMFNYYIAKLLDITQRSDDEETKKEADYKLGLLTPIAKAFLTETGFESANLGVQCFGGHGFISEWGLEQNVRDSRISTLYEGTTGIQSLDLIGRKILGTKGERLKAFTNDISNFCESNSGAENMNEFITDLQKHNKEWGQLAMKIGGAANKNPDELGAASVDFLMYSGYVTLSYFWAQAAAVAFKKLADGTTEQDFYNAKIDTARFFFQRMLPRTRGYVATMNSGAANLMKIHPDHFAF